MHGTPSNKRVDVEQGEVSDVIDTLRKMLQDLQSSTVHGPESLDVQTLRRSILSSIAELETLRLR